MFFFTSAVPRRKPPADIVALDFGASGIKAVRLRRTPQAVTLVQADILPLVEAKEGSSAPERPAFPRGLLANYAALAVSSAHAAVRILTLPGRLDDESVRDGQIREHMAPAKDQRLAYAVITPPKLHNENRFLVVTLPEAECQALLGLFAEGPPAPLSLELAGLAAVTAFLRGPGRAHPEGPVIVVESGEQCTTMAILRGRLPVLVRKFDLGMRSVERHVQERLGVDAETARGILADGSFDISQALHEVVDPFLRQLVLSREFIERREECRVEKLYVSGGMSLSRFWVDELARAAGVAVEKWNPLEGLVLAPNAWPAGLAGQQTRFTAAIGAGLGVWGDS